MTEFLFQLVSCAFLTGLIWVIQILHYPAFGSVRENEFTLFHERHSRRITWIVGPVMLLELATAIMLVVQYPDCVLLWINLLCLLMIWLSTALLSVPIHNSLGLAQDLVKIERLVKTNWPRTILWSSRLILLLFVALHAQGLLPSR